MRGPGWTALQDDYLQRIRHYARCDMVEHADDNELSRRWPNRDTVVALEASGGFLPCRATRNSVPGRSHRMRQRIRRTLPEMQNLPEARIQRVRTYRWRSSVPVVRRAQHATVVSACVAGLEHQRPRSNETAPHRSIHVRAVIDNRFRDRRGCRAVCWNMNNAGVIRVDDTRAINCSAPCPRIAATSTSVALAP
jgi:hypothetical protein